MITKHKKQEPKKKKPKSAWHPIYWPLWFGFGLLWLITQLPYRIQMKIGRMIGRMIMRFDKRANYIASTNIQLCFPELTLPDRQHLLAKNFESLGMGFIETILAWWAPAKKLQALLHLHGFEHLTNALKEGRGALILSPHFNSVHLSGRLMGLLQPGAVMFHAQQNPVITKIILHAMRKHYQVIIKREDVRAMVRCLKQNMPIGYLPDIDPGRTNNVFVPFMGVTASTLTATARFAEMAGTRVIPFILYRRDDGLGYEGIFMPPLENYPSDNSEQDAIRVNNIIEAAIRAHPEQYLWQYKRFKTRPPGEEKIYKKEMLK